MAAKTKRPKTVAPVVTAASQPQLPGWLLRAAEFGKRRIAFAVASAILLIPCFWGSRLQAGDLSSHIYNAWLAQLIHQGRAPGLTIAPQMTNVLFDLMLSGLLPMVGVNAAQRIAVSVCVLAFAWGAFAFTSAAAGRRAWHMMPMIAMLAYGWVFHMGFFNFYLSLGLCLGAAALAWNWKRSRLAGAAALLAVAYTAHALPVLWTIGVMLYLWLAARTPADRRLYLALRVAFLVLLGRVVLTWTVETHWFSSQLKSVAGVDQFAVFDDKYTLAWLGFLTLWILAFAGLVRQWGWRRIFANDLLHASLLTALGIAVYPTMVKLPAYKHALAFIADRMSLPLCVLFGAFLAAARTRVYQVYAMAGVALLFFAFLFRDEAALNRYEDQMAAVVAPLPPLSRVLNGVDAPDIRVNALAHMIDRVCIGRCYSYANYEPSTAQFRIRIAGDSPIILPVYEDSWRAQAGVYVIKPRDLPLYQILANEQGQLLIRQPPAGGPSGLTYWNPLQ